jgi:hypothetical protein
MGEWKINMTLRVRPETRQEMDAFAAQEQRTLSNLATVLLQWAFEKLKAAGSVHDLTHGKEMHLIRYKRRT